MKSLWRRLHAGTGVARRASLDPAEAIARALAAAGLADATGPVRGTSGPAHPGAGPTPREVAEKHPIVRDVHAFGGDSRRYRAFVPEPIPGRPRGLVMMLHGCTQGADDFAAGTRMDSHAAARGWIVVYPEQEPRANGARCWNWFQPSDQRRGAGEPGLLAALTRALVAAHGVDPRQVHVAGLSAGGAMAAILAREHPELYASYGVHSGLPAGAAHDVPSAFAAMKQGAGTAGGARGAPVIVVHGDEDPTVAAINGEAFVAMQRPAQVRREQGRAGRDYVRSVHLDERGRVVAEHWSLRGAGHAWSGGSKEGSWTDPAGPDASACLLEFFAENRRRD